MNATALYGLLASALVIGAAASRLALGRPRLTGIVAGLLAYVTVAPAVHGALGAPSFTLAQLCLLQLMLNRRLPLLKRPAALVIVAVAVAFYPLALGLGPLDPYDLGYRPLPLLCLLAPIGAWLAWRRQRPWLLVIAFDLLAYAAGLFDNLWDALGDPLLVALAVIALIRRPQWARASPIS